jgi:hypothetical protein
MTELYPELDMETTDYRLYIPKDMTKLNIVAVAEDVGASCDLPSEITVDENHLDGKYKVKVEYAGIFGECMALAERIEDPFPD